MLNKMADIMDDISTLKKELDILSYKYKECYYLKPQIKGVIDVCETIGSDKSTIKGFFGSYTNLRDLIVDRGNSDLLDTSNYDFAPQKNEQNTKFIDELNYLFETMNNISSSILQAMDERYKSYCQTCNEYILLVKDYFSQASEELSNTSLEVIPAKAKSCSFECYPLEGGRINTDSLKKTLTIQELNLTTQELIELTDKILGSMETVEVRQSGLSEVPSETDIVLTETEKAFDKRKRLAFSGMKIIENYKKCY